MKVYEFGKEHSRSFAMFQCAAEPWWVFKASAEEIRNLKEVGDSIHVLGLNIVRTETGTNRITISDKYIRETCKSLCAWLCKTDEEQTQEEFSKLFGQISFIKQYSPGSYEKLRKMTKIKCGYDGPLTAKALMPKRTIE